MSDSSWKKEFKTGFEIVCRQRSNQQTHLAVCDGRGVARGVLAPNAQIELLQNRGRCLNKEKVKNMKKTNTKYKHHP
jgi:hypothetical protein